MLPQEVSGQRILFSPLNWGSGHVARSIPLLKELLTQENDLFIWCTSAQETVYRRYGIEAVFIVKAGFSFQFKGDGNFTKEISRNAWNFMQSVRSDRKETENLVRQFSVSLIISDHVYGLCSKSIPSVFITHQVFLPPKSGWLAQTVHRKWMKKFSLIWIMDSESERLAKELSKPIEKCVYIGWYSRFKNADITLAEGKVVAVISGPEPYSEQLFREVIEKYSNARELVIVSQRKYASLPISVRVVTDWLEADREIASAETIVSRNGYTTLMDMQFLNKKAILVPTPGQLEQEYLAGQG